MTEYMSINNHCSGDNTCIKSDALGDIEVPANLRVFLVRYGLRYFYQVVIFHVEVNVRAMMVENYSCMSCDVCNANFRVN